MKIKPVLNSAPNSLSRTTCPLCGSGDSRRLFRPKRSPGPVVRCQNCDFVYVGPILRTDHIVAEAQMLESVPDELRSTADLALLEGRWEKALIDGYMREYPQKMQNANELLATIERFVPKGNILDFGAGPGLFLEAARERGWRPYGLEPLVGFAIFARGNFGLPVVNDLLRDGVFPEGRFDAITAIQVLEHVTDPLSELSKLRRLLRSGGVLAVEVPNVASPWVRLLGAKHRHFVEDHLNFFGPRTLRHFLELGGLTVVQEGFSTRQISVRSVFSQLLRQIGTRRGPFGALEELISGTGLGRTTVALNLGDIVYAIASK